MKLWIKSLIALGVTGAVTGAALGGLYAYSKTDASKGNTHLSSRGLRNNLEDFKSFNPNDAYFVSPNNDQVEIGHYDYMSDTVDGVDAKQWVNDQMNNGVAPIMRIQAGPVQFENYYCDAIFPKTYLNFVEWFSTEVSWGADISSLTTFRIKRGILKAVGGSVLTLGNYAARSQTSKVIQFIPDSFYGSAPLRNFTVDISNQTYSKDELSKFVDIFNKNNEALPKEERLKIFSIEKKGYDQYQPIIASADDVLFQDRRG